MIKEAIAKLVAKQDLAEPMMIEVMELNLWWRVRSAECGLCALHMKGRPSRRSPGPPG
ncbi:MAG: hypothetical protein R2864_09890 [Syntrophotaleaceae bacterium]